MISGFSRPVKHFPFHANLIVTGCLASDNSAFQQSPWTWRKRYSDRFQITLKGYPSSYCHCSKSFWPSISNQFKSVLESSWKFPVHIRHTCMEIRERSIYVLEKSRADWLKLMETEPARAVDEMMARANRIYLLIINVNKLFSFSSSRCFLKK